MSDATLTAHAPATVGEVMHSDFAALQAHWTVAEAIRGLREQELKSAILYLYVVDEDGTLCGVLPVRRLLTAPEAQPIAELTIRDVKTITPDVPILDASELFLKHRFLAMPVVDRDRRILGVVDLPSISGHATAPAERESVDAAFQLIGVHVRLGRKVSPWVSFRDRFPWLLCNVASGIACALIAGLYESTLEAVTLIALFLTVVLALGESVSMQSLTLTMQFITGGGVKFGQLWRQLRQEAATATMLGLGCGLLVGAVVLIWKRSFLGLITVAGSIMLSIFLACMLGILVPTTMKALRADPRIAAGPITLAATDIFTLFLYFSAATWLLA